MKEQDIIKAVAELDGWIKIASFSDQGLSYLAGYHPARAVHQRLAVPDYLTSYDAILPVIQKQPKPMFHASMSHLFEKHVVEYTIFATPRQLCEALLRATGKWIE